MTEPVTIITNKEVEESLDNLVNILLKQTGARDIVEVRKMFESGLWYAQSRNPIIDHTLPPYVPEEWTQEVEKTFNVLGEFIWEPERIHLYQTDTQKRGGLIHGPELIREIRSQTDLTMLSSNVLTFLKRHPLMINSDWRPCNLFALGTRYHKPGEDVTAFASIRLYHNQWISDIRRTSEHWGPTDVILTLRS